MVQSTQHSVRSEWNPATDEHLPARYDITSFLEGKAACKAALQVRVCRCCRWGSLRCCSA